MDYEARTRNLEERVAALESLLTLSGMSLETRDVIRSAVVLREDNDTDLTEQYGLDIAGETVIAPKSYAGTIIVLGQGGRPYSVPYINEQ